MADQSLIANLELAKLASVTTPGPTPSSMPVTNLLHHQPGKNCRFLDLTQAEATLDLTLALAAVADTGISSYRYIIIIASTITRTGTVEVFTGPTQVSVASAGTASLHVPAQLFWLTVENNGNRFPKRHTYIDLGSQRTEPFVRVVFSDPTNPDGFLDVGVIFPSPGYVPTSGIRQQPNFGADEELRETISVAGARHTQPRPINRIRDIIIQANGPTAAAEIQDQWVALQETVGVHDPFAAITRLGATSRYMDHFVYGTLTGLVAVPLAEIWGESSITLTYKELK